MSKIFCFTEGHWVGGDLRVIAVSEDGYALAHHVSSDVGWAKHDIGITSDRKHEAYREKYPDGYELEWVDKPATHEGIRVAGEIAKDRAAEEVR